MRATSILFLVAATALPRASLAQTPETLDHTDMALWLDGTLDLRASKRLHVGLEQHLRLNEDVSELDALMTEAHVRYKANRHLRLEGGYRFLYAHDGGGWDLETWHRLFAGARADFDLGPATIDLRLRAQEQVRFADTAEQEHVARARGRLTFPLGAISLSGSYELFLRIARDVTTRAQKWRAFVGVEREFEHVTLGLDAGYESFFARNRATMILSCSAGWRFD